VDLQFAHQQQIQHAELIAIAEDDDGAARFGAKTRPSAKWMVNGRKGA